jgi:hypothetical protein
VKRTSNSTFHGDDPPPQDLPNMIKMEPDNDYSRISPLMHCWKFCPMRSKNSWGKPV